MNKEISLPWEIKWVVSPKKCTSENKKGMGHCEYLNEENTWKSEIWRSVCENFNM